MATKITNYHCNSCENGIVMVKEKQSGNLFSLNFGDCNVCKKSFGLFSIIKLKEVANILPGKNNSRVKYYRQAMVLDRLPSIGLEHITCFVSERSGSSTYSKVTEKTQEIIYARHTYWLEEI